MRPTGCHQTPVIAANTWTGRSRSRPDTRCGSRPPNATPSRPSSSAVVQHQTQRPRVPGRSPPFCQKRPAKRPAPTLSPRLRVAPTTRAAPKRAPRARLRCTSANPDTGPDWMAITTASPANRRGNALSRRRRPNRPPGNPPGVISMRASGRRSRRARSRRRGCRRRRGDSRSGIIHLERHAAAGPHVKRSGSTASLPHLKRFGCRCRRSVVSGWVDPWRWPR